MNNIYIYIHVNNYVCIYIKYVVYIYIHNYVKVYVNNLIVYIYIYICIASLKARKRHESSSLVHYYLRKFKTCLPFEGLHLAL